MTHYGTAGQIPIGASTAGFNLYAYTPVRGMRRSEIAGVARDFAVRCTRRTRPVSTAWRCMPATDTSFPQFLSPYTNRRRDEYGGLALKNRMRFMRMCLEEVMEAAAPHGAPPCW